MKVTRIYSDAEGTSRFEDIEIELFPCGDIGSMSEAIPTTSLLFRQHSGDHDWDWHTTPRRQYMVLLKGSVVIEVADGTSRRFGPNDVLLLEDTEGKGHLSKSPDGRPRSCLFITLD